MGRVAIVLALIVVALAAFPALVVADQHVDSISRDARGSQPTGDYGPLGSPPTPSLYLLSQTTIFTVGLVLLLIAAVLGAFTFVLSRRAPARR